MTELEFELEFKKRKLQKRKQRRMELLIIGAHLGVVLVLLYWMFGIGMVHDRSMRPAYRDGDLFLYQRRLFREPDYGDVVVIHRQDLERDIVKRIAGKPGDVIEVIESSRSSVKFSKLLGEEAPVVLLPSWLERDKNALKGTVTKLPVREDIDVPIAEHLIVELYSK